MIKSFEPVYKELEELFIHKLPEYIEKINKEYNDGIILTRFENTELEEESLRTPSFKFKLEESENEEKDRIIENTIFKVSFEIKLQPHTENKTKVLWRYFEAIKITLLSENDISLWQCIEIADIINKKITIKITI